MVGSQPKPPDTEGRYEADASRPATEPLPCEINDADLPDSDSPRDDESDTLHRCVDPLRIGQCIGPYRVVRRLGHGGMGVVYEAVHQEIGQRIAIKLLATNLAEDPSFRKRFLREAQAGSKVRHPGLVQIFNYGTLDSGTPFIQMEFLEGRLLRAYMAQQPDFRLPLDAALRVGRQVADALAAAHAAGIVHRDLKPDNVMLVTDHEAEGGERTRVLDFGIAKFLRAPEMITLSAGEQSLGAIGTPVYMSPEQCRGDETLSGSSDVYSLGVMLYEMLCGRPPFVSDPELPMGVVFQHVFADPRPPRQLRLDLPEQVAGLLLRMLAKEPERRPDMTVVSAEIKALADSVVPTGRNHLRLQIPGARIATPMTMVLLVLLPVLLEILYFAQHHEFWWPTREPRSPSMVQIPAADFDMGSTQAEVAEALQWAKLWKNCKDCEPSLYERELPLRHVHVSSFYMDTREVTNEEFAGWLNGRKNVDVDAWGRQVRIDGQLIADLGKKEEQPEQRYVGIDWTGSRFRVREGMARKPVVLVTWDGARRYCQDHGKRLPTEAEWELAARGSERRRFPWGDDDPGCADAVFDWSRSALKCGKVSTGPVDVGTTPRDRTSLGVADLAGNVAEWVMDSYREHYPSCDGICRDPVVDKESFKPDGASRAVVRGGSWFSEVDACRGASRSRDLRTRARGDTGFRCARPAKS